MANPTWTRVKEVLDGALAKPPAERMAFVAQACGEDDALRAEVQSLLAAIEGSDAFMQRPALASLTASAVLGVPPIDQARTLQPNDTIGPYRIVGFIGAGGMGEVYRARDSKLNRDVALKVLPDAFAGDSDRLTRFSREAQALASLNHPNIAAIYGLEESEGGRALVLELVEGPTLADRIASAPMLVRDALTIASQIAEGLEAAHRRGIVHRDLKPSNIKVRPDGRVQILDFGLAKDAAEPIAGTGVTRAGVIIGTAAYMSPEQGRGQATDKRTDIWAFGCVLYEMLAGRPCFTGETDQDTLAAVLTREPDWTALPHDTPPAVAAVLRRCLEKNTGRRWHDIADARIEIEDGSARTPTHIGAHRRWPLVAAAVAVTVMTVATAGWSWFRIDRTPDRTVRRLQMQLPETRSLADPRVMPLGLGQPSIAISPDGARVAYVLSRNGVRQLYLRALNDLNATPVDHTDGAFGPFFSPDGRWVGFFADNKIKKVAVAGGSPFVLCDAPNPYGGSWGTDGGILFAIDEGRRLARVSESGDPCRGLSIKDNRGSWRQPEILPDGKSAILSNPALGVGVMSLPTGEFRNLVPDAGGGRYAPSGHLIFTRGDELFALPFDLARLTVSGAPTLLLDGVRADGAQVTVPQAAFSRDGTLIYAPGGAGNDDVTRPVWVDRHGKVEPLGLPPRAYRSFRLSPDARRLAIVIANPNNDIWVYDLDRRGLTRLTSGGNNVQPSWTADGRRVVFLERTGGRVAGFSVPADGSSAPEQMATQVPSDRTNGEVVVSATGGDPATGRDLWVRRLRGDQTPQPFLRTRFAEVGPKFSPDGRYIAYVSDESGQYEVYVRPYPQRAAKWQISTNGGEEEIWSRDGREMFYRNGNKWMVVDVSLTPEFKAGTPRVLFEGPYVNVGGLSYDVTSDGQRFLVLEPAPQDPVTHLNVVLNWFEEVNQKVSAASAR